MLSSAVLATVSARRGNIRAPAHVWMSYCFDSPPPTDEVRSVPVRPVSPEYSRNTAALERQKIQDANDEDFYDR